jgi:serine/threonine protein phosphatase PrpC
LHDTEAIKTVFKNSFETLDGQLCSPSAPFDTFLSGTTFTAILVHREKIYAANVGDSRAVLFKKEAGNSIIESIYLTKDHKPDLECEKERIEKCNGRVHPIIHKSNGRRIGVHRVWCKN